MPSAAARIRERASDNGIGGGSLLSPILAGRGVPWAELAPAAPTSTLITSIAGAATYAGITIATGGTDIAPDWTIGLRLRPRPAGRRIPRRTPATTTPRHSAAPGPRRRGYRDRRPQYRPNPRRPQSGRGAGAIGRGLDDRPRYP